MPSIQPFPASYTPLSEDEESHLDTKLNHSPLAPHRSRARLLTITFHITVLGFAIWGLLCALCSLFPSLHNLYYQPTTPSRRPSTITLSPEGYLQPPYQRSCRCGSTVAEARARNCSYDSLAAAWLPPHCIDFELLRQWENAGPGPSGQWEYFADQRRKKQLTLLEVAELPSRASGERMFYTTLEWHVKHCAFGWRKQYRSAATGVTMDRRSDGTMHIAHCEAMFLRREGLQQLVTMVGVSLDADEGAEGLEA